MHCGVVFLSNIYVCPEDADHRDKSASTRLTRAMVFSMSSAFSHILDQVKVLESLCDPDTRCKLSLPAIASDSDLEGELEPKVSQQVVIFRKHPIVELTQ